MNVRQKLTEPESTAAFVVGGGLALFILGFLLAASQSGVPNFDASKLDKVMFVGGLLMVGGAVLWVFTSRPWTKFDDWSTPLYTGHHDTGHAAASHDTHAAAPDVATLGVEAHDVEHAEEIKVVLATGGSIPVENLEGIGPKIAAALHAVGIATTAELAFRPPLELEKVVRDAGVRMVGHADAWVEQAKLAEEGRFAELEEYQNNLRGKKTH